MECGRVERRSRSIDDELAGEGGWRLSSSRLGSTDPFLGACVLKEAGRLLLQRRRRGVGRLLVDSSLGLTTDSL